MNEQSECMFLHFQTIALSPLYPPRQDLRVLEKQ
jgi:hypothetical protein